MRDDGFRHLQTAADNLQIVIPNTSPAGREVMRRHLQDCQHNWDNSTGKLVDVKSRMEGCLAQIALYDEGIIHLEKWLQDMEQSLKDEQQLHATIPEKKAQLERTKV